jgi:hypothetical protein
MHCGHDFNNSRSCLESLDACRPSHLRHAWIYWLQTVRYQTLGSQAADGGPAHARSAVTLDTRSPSSYFEKVDASLGLPASNHAVHISWESQFEPAASPGGGAEASNKQTCNHPKIESHLEPPLSRESAQCLRPSIGHGMGGKLCLVA